MTTTQFAVAVTTEATRTAHTMPADAPAWMIARDTWTPENDRIWAQNGFCDAGRGFGGLTYAVTDWQREAYAQGQREGAYAEGAANARFNQGFWGARFAEYFGGNVYEAYVAGYGA
jgi:hypothetical protein